MDPNAALNDEQGTVVDLPNAMPWDVTLTVARLPNGEYRAVGITLEPKRGHLADAGITVDSLRRLPLRRLVSAAIASKLGDEHEALRRWRTTSRGDPDHLAAVAQVYREAAERGRALEGGPRGAIQRTWSVSQKTADRWIKAAREAGVLERPPKGRGSTPQTPRPTRGRDEREGR